MEVWSLYPLCVLTLLLTAALWLGLSRAVSRTHWCMRAHSHSLSSQAFKLQAQGDKNICLKFIQRTFVVRKPASSQHSPVTTGRNIVAHSSNTLHLYMSDCSHVLCGPFGASLQDLQAAKSSIASWKASVSHAVTWLQYLSFPYRSRAHVTSTNSRD